MWRALPVVHQLAKMRRPKLRVVGRVEQPPEVEFDAEPLGRPPGRIRHQLHEATRAGARLRARIKGALLARDGVTPSPSQPGR